MLLFWCESNDQWHDRREIMKRDQGKKGTILTYNEKGQREQWRVLVSDAGAGVCAYANGCVYLFVWIINVVVISWITALSIITATRMTHVTIRLKAWAPATVLFCTLGSCMRTARPAPRPGWGEAVSHHGDISKSGGGYC